MPVTRIEKNTDGTDRGSVMRKSDKATGARGPDGEEYHQNGGLVLLIWRFPDGGGSHLMVGVAGNSICRLFRLL